MCVCVCVCVYVYTFSDKKLKKKKKLDAASALPSPPLSTHLGKSLSTTRVLFLSVDLHIIRTFRNILLLFLHVSD